MDIKKILLASLLSSTAIVGGCDLSGKNTTPTPQNIVDIFVKKETENNAEKAQNQEGNQQEAND
ncbi:hypothetical protein Q7M74_05600 (plasmid) [Candidatus Liberibacter asiaticus]